MIKIRKRNYTINSSNRRISSQFTLVEAKLTVVTAFSFAVLANFEAFEEKRLQPDAKVVSVESIIS